MVENLLNIQNGPALGVLPKGFSQRQRIGAIIFWGHCDHQRPEELCPTKRSERGLKASCVNWNARQLKLVMWAGQGWAVAK